MHIKDQLARIALAERGRQRRMSIKTYKASNFSEAEAWDLDYWQGVGPQGRLEAYMAIREDVEKVNRARNANG
jgi:hypothetical protein